MKRRERQKEGRNETMRKHITKIFVLFLAAIVASGAYLPGMVNRVYADEVEEATVTESEDIPLYGTVKGLLCDSTANRDQCIKAAITVATPASNIINYNMVDESELPAQVKEWYRALDNHEMTVAEVMAEWLQTEEYKTNSADIRAAGDKYGPIYYLQVLPNGNPLHNQGATSDEEGATRIECQIKRIIQETDLPIEWICSYYIGENSPYLKRMYSSDYPDSRNMFKDPSRRELMDPETHRAIDTGMTWGEYWTQQYEGLEFPFKEYGDRNSWFIPTLQAPDIEWGYFPGTYPNIDPLTVDAVAVNSFVERMYVNLLGRGSDQAGRWDWVGQLLDKKINGASIAYGFAHSVEFENMYKTMSPEVFVTTLYKTFLDRDPDAGGLAYWVSCVENGAPADWIIGGFVNSQEFDGLCSNAGIERGEYERGAYNPEIDRAKLGAFVERFYTEALGRASDEDGKRYWVSKIASGELKPEDLVYGFLGSVEFAEKSAQMSNEEYVTCMYHTFFGREADAEGFDYWVSSLNNGTKARQDIIDGFVGSQEYLKMVDSFLGKSTN